MIVPTIGRVVLFTPSTTPDPGFVHNDAFKPCAAMVTHVWGERLVNLVVFDSNGTAFGKTSVQLLQDDDAKPEYGYFCSWMPYQVGQAKKHEGEGAAIAGTGAIKLGSIRCDGGCVYSRSMSQPYPRACVKCGCPEGAAKLPSIGPNT